MSTSATDPGWCDGVVAHARRLWGDELRPVGPERVHPGLSGATRRFLTDVGLPHFEPTVGLRCVPDRTDRILTSNGRDYVVVGGICGSGGVVYGVDVQTDQVVCVVVHDPPWDSTHEPKLVNTTLALWVLFLGVGEREISPQVGVVEPESVEAEALVEGVRQFFAGLDPVAMRSVGLHWQAYLDDLDAGWEPAVEPTPGFGPLAVFGSPQLDGWLAGRKAEFSAWVARWAPDGDWDFSPFSLDRLTGLLIGQLGEDPDALREPDHGELVDGSAWYLGETYRQAGGGQWSWRQRPVVVSVRNPVVGLDPVVQLKLGMLKPGYLGENCAEMAGLN